MFLGPDESSTYVENVSGIVSILENGKLLCVSYLFYGLQLFFI